MEQHTINQLNKLAEKYPEVQLALDELDILYNDPSAKFYVELVKMTEALTEEMALARKGEDKETGFPHDSDVDEEPKSKLHILGSSDKLFERIRSLMIDSAKIFDGIEKGKQLLTKGNTDSIKDNKKKRTEGSVAL